MLKSTDSTIQEPATSKIYEIYISSCRTAGSGPGLASQSTNDMLRYLLWVQMQHSLYDAHERQKTRYPFATTATKQHGIPACPSSKLPTADLIDNLIDISGPPEPDWYLFEDEEDDDILLSDEVYCDEREKWQNPPGSAYEYSQVKVTPMISSLLPDSDEILPSSPCLLTEIDTDSIPGQCLKDGLEIDTGVAMDMDILQSSSPLILPSPINLPMGDGGPCDTESDRLVMLFNIPSLDSGDVEMMLI